MVDFNKLLAGNSAPPVNLSGLSPEVIVALSGQAQAGQQAQVNTALALQKMLQQQGQFESSQAQQQGQFDQSQLLARDKLAQEKELSLISNDRLDRLAEDTIKHHRSLEENARKQLALTGDQMAFNKTMTENKMVPMTKGGKLAMVPALKAAEYANNGYISMEARLAQRAEERANEAAKVEAGQRQDYEYNGIKFQDASPELIAKFEKLKVSGGLSAADQLKLDKMKQDYDMFMAKFKQDQAHFEASLGLDKQKETRLEEEGQQKQTERFKDSQALILTDLSNPKYKGPTKQGLISQYNDNAVKAGDRSLVYWDPSYLSEDYKHFTLPSTITTAKGAKKPMDMATFKAMADADYGGDYSKLILDMLADKEKGIISW